MLLQENLAASQAALDAALAEGRQQRQLLQQREAAAVELATSVEDARKQAAKVRHVWTVASHVPNDTALCQLRQIRLAAWSADVYLLWHCWQLQSLLSDASIGSRCNRHVIHVAGTGAGAGYRAGAPSPGEARGAAAEGHQVSKSSVCSVSCNTHHVCNGPSIPDPC